MSIPEAVRDAALFPADDLPETPPQHPYQVVRREGFAVGMFAGFSFGTVDVRSVAEHDLERTVSEARGILLAHGLQKAAWSVPEAAFPPRLVDRLAGFGMTPYDEPPFEPRRASLVLVAPPASSPAEVTARPAKTFDEYRAASRVSVDAFQMSDDDRRALETQEELLWGIESSWPHYQTFVAIIDGQVVGSAGSIYGASAVYLAGGSTREDARGRGAYRALVLARWSAAVERGTPALTVAAESMSRPILERLGFVNVGWTDCLIDRFA